MRRNGGFVQCGIVAAFEQQPGARFTIEELAGRIYPGMDIGKPQSEAVRRAVQGLRDTLGLHICRVSGPKGWHFRIGRK